METEKIIISFDDWENLGYNGEILFLCPCGCKKVFNITVYNHPTQLREQKENERRNKEIFAY